MVKLARGATAESQVIPAGSIIRLVLIYGPDGGLAHERAGKLVETLAGDRRDPFRVVELSAGALKEQPGRLLDEAGALPFTGGRRVVWVRDAADALTGLCTGFLDNFHGDGVVVLEAGDLPARSSLRKLAEGSNRALAVPCYHDSGAELRQVITQGLNQNGLSMEEDALAWVLAHMGSDRMVSRGEIDKLMLAMMGQKRITLADVMANLGDTASLALDDLLAAVAEGQQSRLDVLLERAFQAGETPVGIVRAALRHFQRLHLVASQGGDLSVLRPPPFPRQAESLRRHLSLWPLPKLSQALERLLEAEIHCKTTGLPDTIICARILGGLTGLAQPRR